MDIIIATRGAISYESLMNMPLPMIDIFIERANAKNEQSNQ